jgi:hypothetical protein
MAARVASPHGWWGSSVSTANDHGIHAAGCGAGWLAAKEKPGPPRLHDNLARSAPHGGLRRRIPSLRKGKIEMWGIKRGQAPGASDFFSSLSWPTAAGDVVGRSLRADTVRWLSEPPCVWRCLVVAGLVPAAPRRLAPRACVVFRCVESQGCETPTRKWLCTGKQSESIGR